MIDMRLRLGIGIVLVICTLGAANAMAAGPPPSEPLAPADYVPPSIAGSASTGSTVACTPGYWLNNPTSYVYSWQRNGTTTSGPSGGNGYTLTAADAGQSITCSVFASNGWGSSSATSSPIVPVAAAGNGAPANESPPAITGGPEVGETVGCAPGAWWNGPTRYSFAWQRNGSTLAGQTTNQYTVTSSDFNQALTCQVVASNASGSGAPATSPPVFPGPGYSTDQTGQNGPSGGSPNYFGWFGQSRARSARKRRSARRLLPRLWAVSVSPGRMLVVGRGVHAHTAGLTFRFVLDRRAEVVVLIERRHLGRRVSGRCAAVKRQSNRGATCNRYVVVRTVAMMTNAGKRRLWYSGRAATGLLPAGNYRALVAAQTPAGWSKLHWVAFVVVRTR